MNDRKYWKFNGYSLAWQLVGRFCSKPYLCIIILIILSPILSLSYCIYTSNMRYMTDTSFIPIMFGWLYYLACILWMIPRALLDIQKVFYTGRINVSQLKENKVLRFICSDDFFLALSKNSKLSLEDKIIDVITILFYIFMFILIIYLSYCP